MRPLPAESLCVPSPRGGPHVPALSGGLGSTTARGLSSAPVSPLCCAWTGLVSALPCLPLASGEIGVNVM